MRNTRSRQEIYAHKHMWSYYFQRQSQTLQALVVFCGFDDRPPWCLNTPLDWDRYHQETGVCYSGISDEMRLSDRAEREIISFWQNTFSPQIKCERVNSVETLHLIFFSSFFPFPNTS